MNHLNKPVLTSQDVDRVMVSLEPLEFYPSDLVRKKVQEILLSLRSLSLTLFDESVRLYMKDKERV